MTNTAVLGGFAFLTLVLMFGGRKRRTFAEASHKAAALIMGSLGVIALIVLLTGTLSHVLGFARADNGARDVVQVGER
jgi:hypothetical protein